MNIWYGVAEWLCSATVQPDPTARPVAVNDRERTRTELKLYTSVSMLEGCTHRQAAKSAALRSAQPMCSVSQHLRQA